MKRMLALAVVAMTAIGCRGDRGRTGPEGPPGEEGPPGPILEPPEIASISPDSGSAGTIWTLIGKNFDSGTKGFETTPTVLFDGFPAAVLEANAGMIRVTAAFDPVEEISLKTVVVEARNQLSNTMPVYAFPSGSARELDFASRIFGTPEAIARDGDALWIVDRERGAFRFDFTTKVLTAPFVNGRDGFETAWNVFAPGSGSYLLEKKTNGEQPTFVLHRITGDSLVPLWASYAELTALAEDSTGRSYEATGTLVRRYAATGEYDGWYFWAPAEVGGMAILGNNLYVTEPSASRIMRTPIDTAPALVDFVALTEPRALVADGTYLFVAAGSFLHRVTTGGTVTQWTSSSYGVEMDEASLVFAPGGGFLFASDWASHVMKVDAAGANPSVALGGMMSARGLVRFGAGTVAYDQVYSGRFPFIGGVPYGAFPFFGDDGTVKISLTGPIPVEAMTAYKTGFAIPSADTDKVFFLDGTTGEVTLLVGPPDVDFPMAVVALDGNLYVAHHLGMVGRLAPDGTWIPDYLLAPEPVTPYGMTASGGKLWVHALDDMGGGIYAASLADEWVRVTPDRIALYPFAEVYYYHGDTLAPDGAGGVFFADGNSGDILRITPEGEIAWMTAFGGDLRVAAVEPDPRTADVLLGNGVSYADPAREPVGAMMP